MIKCRSCDYQAKDFADLALHIATSKKNHRKGKKWAASFMLKVNLLDKKKPLERGALTDEERDAIKENKKETVREVSGRLVRVNAICPKCNKAHIEEIPVEYAQSKTAWRTNMGTFMITCLNCSR